MRKLKVSGLAGDGLKIFYITNIRSIICYAAPAWFTFLSQCDIDRLEKIQRTAMRMIFPDDDYDVRLCLLQLLVLSEFTLHLSSAHFNKILNNDCITELFLISKEGHLDQRPSSVQLNVVL